MKRILDICRAIQAGNYDSILAQMYCRSGNELIPYRERIIHLTEGYRSVFDRDETAEVSVYSAPGRTELGGNHTDHQQGKVLTGSVDLDALACAAPNGTGEIRIFSEGYGMMTVNVNELSPVSSEQNSTSAIIRGVVAGITNMGFSVKGFDAYVTSNVPGGSGLSSSACFEVLLGQTINGLFCGNKLYPAAIAKVGQYAENVFFGKPSGLLDQMGCALGGIVAIDFRNREEPEYHAVNVDFGKAGYALCIVDTGADHADLTDDYAAIPKEMKQVAGYFGRDVLSQVEESAFYQAIPDLRQCLGDRPVLRAIHYFTDCHRVEEQVAALEKGNFDRFLQLVSSSGHSSYMYLQNVSTYRDPGDQPVAVALAMAGYYLKNHGARRVHGGGFAGTIQAYVPISMVEEFKSGMDALLGDGACRVTYIRPIGCCTVK